MTVKFLKRDIWWVKEPGVTSEVVHIAPDPQLQALGLPSEHRWYIYVYIWQESPYFDKVEHDLHDPVVATWGFHKGCSYAERILYGSTLCKKFGFDYNHHGDDAFERLGVEDAGIFLAEAERLSLLLRSPRSGEQIRDAGSSKVQGDKPEQTA